MRPWPTVRVAPALLAFCAACAREADFEGLVPTPSGSLFVRSRGEGPHLVLLHGLGDSSVGWRKVEGGLRGGGFRVTVWDALGAGRSEKPLNGDYRLVAHVERLGTVLDRLGLPDEAAVGGGFERLPLFHSR